MQAATRESLMGVLSAYNMLREPMQHVATYCNTLQRAATYRNTLQHGTRGDVLDVLSVCSSKSSGCQPRAVTHLGYVYPVTTPVVIIH